MSRPTGSTAKPSTSCPPLILRARLVLPLNRPPIEDGAVAIASDRVIAVGSCRDLKRRLQQGIMDLGDVVLLPGLVNAHCHLDYTHMAGLFPPRRSFCDWIKLITTEKAQWGYTDFAASWVDGAKMLLRSGTTTVADIEAVPELLPEVWETTPLRVFSLLEMTGVRSRRDPKRILREALDKIETLPTGRSRAGLSPHAPYSTTPELLRRAATVARRHKLRVATHVGESATEFEMFMRARGEMFEWLQRNERSMSDCGRISPVQALARQRALGSHLLAVHVNHLAPGDAACLARTHTNVVHCPRSHHYFSHAPFPYRSLARAGVNLCLGTDSLATVRKNPKQTVALDMFSEMREFAERHPEVPSIRVVEMATINGARALGLGVQVGELKRGAFADLIAVPFCGKLAHAPEAVVHHSGQITAGMIAGEWTVPPP